MAFAIGVLGLAAGAAMVAPPPARDDGNGVDLPANIATPATSDSPGMAQPRPAPFVGGMISNSYSSGPPVAVPGSSTPQPPIVAIPRIPGPALARERVRTSNAFCVSTTPPPPEREYGFLFDVRLEDNEMVALETYPSMAACERALAAGTPKPGHQAGCSPKFH